jgi:hypothetical protein
LIRRTHGRRVPGGDREIRDRSRDSDHSRGPGETPDRGRRGRPHRRRRDIFIDEGFTPQLIAEALATDRPLTVVTASLNTAAWMATTRRPRCCCSGAGYAAGRWPPVDHWAAGMLAGFVIDLAFVGANGISRESG